MPERSFAPEDLARQLPNHEQAISTHEIEAMLAHVVRVPHLLMEAIPLLKVEYFHQIVEPHYAILWSVLAELCGRYATVTFDMLYTTIAARIDGFPGCMTGQNREDLLSMHSGGILWSIFATPFEQLHPAFGQDLLRRFLRERSVIAPLRRLMTHGNGDTHISNFTEMLEAAQAANRRIETLRESPVSAPVPPRGSPLPPPQTYRPTNLGFFDRYIKGQRPGDANGILGVYGSGKTTLGIQLAVQNARNCWYEGLGAQRLPDLSVLFSYEEPESKIMPRAWANAMRIPRDKMENLDWGKLTTGANLDGYEREIAGNDGLNGGATLSECDRWDQAAVWLNQSFIMFDMSGSEKFPGAGAGLIDEIVALLERASHDRGQQIRSIVCDYAGIMCKRHMEHRNISEDKMRHYIGGLGDQLRRRVSEQFQCTSWLLHQFNAEQNKRNPTTLLHHMDAAEARNFAENLAACLCLGVRDKVTGCLLANWSKVRYFLDRTQSPAVLQIDGKFCEMLDVSEQYMPDVSLAGFIDSRTRQQIHGTEVPTAPVSRGPRGLRTSESNPAMDAIGERGLI